jgi:hypothetical protein
MDTTTEKEILDIMDAFMALLQEGKEEEAKKYVVGEFPRLPKSLRDKILSVMLTQALIDENAEQELADEVQEKGLAGMQMLMKMRAELEKGQQAGSIDKS